MPTLFEKVNALKRIPRLSKHEQLVDGVLQAIESKVVVHGDRLPSVNEMVDNLGFARKTIVKAYDELKERGIIESRNRMGYFVTNDSHQTAKVALILYAFQTFQEVFYNTFRSALGENIHLDVYFHHNNIEVFEQIFTSIKSRYGMYVIAPIMHPKSRKLLKTISPKRLLTIDRNYTLSDEYSQVVQYFEDPLYNELSRLKDKISNYKRFILFYRDNADFPEGVLKGFRRFLKDFSVKGHIEQHYLSGSIEKGNLYFVISDTELWEILKDAQRKNLKVGKDFGILSHNDTPVKEFISGGITTFSTDFMEMAQKAADFVLNREDTQLTIESKIIVRNSL